MERQTDKEIADNLLMEWHLWTDGYRIKLGMPRVAPYCKDSRTSKQYDDPADLTHDKVYQTEMKAVEFCVDSLIPALSAAIGTEMRNREVNAKVWRDPAGKTFAEALEAIMPIMKKKGLFDGRGRL